VSKVKTIQTIPAEPFIFDAEAAVGYRFKAGKEESQDKSDGATKACSRGHKARAILRKKDK
jgi:hypothetical protein